MVSVPNKGVSNMENLLITMNSFPSETNYEEIFSEVKAAGLKGVEIRRELLNEQTPNLREIKRMLTALNLKAYYSCPIALFGKEHQLIDLTTFYKEAIDLGAELIKFSLGDYKENISNIRALGDAVNYFTEAGITFTIENDQTALGGRIDRLVNFFSTCHGARIPIFLTCDIGNWVYVGENPETAIEMLRDETIYIHIKEVIETGKGLETIAIDDTLNQKWKRFLNLFSKIHTMALEFPIKSKVECYTQFIQEGVYVR